jgi:hypothetical protein
MQMGSRTMIYKLIAIFLVLLYTTQLFSEKLTFNIEFKGVKVANVEMVHSQPNQQTYEIFVSAKSGFIANVFTYQIDNQFRINTNRDFMPNKLKKDINQRNFTEKSETLYDFSQLMARYTDDSRDIRREYKILPGTKDFFSGLYYLRTLDLKQPHSLPIDNNGKLSTIKTRYLRSERIRTAIGTVNTNVVELSFEHYDLEPRVRSDILTNNLSNPDNKLFFWFTDDEYQIPVKAQYVMNKMTVFWSIRERV